MTEEAPDLAERLGRERDEARAAAAAAEADRDRMSMLGDAMFVEGYDLALRELCEHFRLTRRGEIATEIEEIRRKRSAEVREVPMPSATHVLWSGRVLCDDLRLRGVPRDWPEGQRWISLKDVAGVQPPPDRCEKCWREAPGRAAGLGLIGADG